MRPRQSLGRYIRNRSKRRAQPLVSYSSLFTNSGTWPQQRILLGIQPPTLTKQKSKESTYMVRHQRSIRPLSSG